MIQLSGQFGPRGMVYRIGLKRRFVHVFPKNKSIEANGPQGAANLDPSDIVGRGLQLIGRIM